VSYYEKAVEPQANARAVTHPAGLARAGRLLLRSLHCRQVSREMIGPKSDMVGRGKLVLMLQAVRWIRPWRWRSLGWRRPLLASSHTS